jgi:CRP-like cAMP-binding protein
MALPIAHMSKLESFEAELLSTMIKDVTFPKGHVFFTEGCAADSCLFLIRSGKVSVRSSLLGSEIEGLVGLFGFKTEGEKSYISEGGFFGADTIKTPGEGKTGPAKYTVTVEDECVVGVLTMKDIWATLMHAPEGKVIPFNQLEMYRILGAGTFGKVLLVSQMGTKDAYALKVQGKRKTIECKFSLSHLM